MQEKIELTHEEKIDYVYLYVKKEERNARNRRIIKIILGLFLVGYFYIAIFVMLPRMLGNIIPGVDMASIQDRFFGNEANTENSNSESSQDNASSFDRVREMFQNNN